MIGPINSIAVDGAFFYIVYVILIVKTNFIIRGFYKFKYFICYAYYDHFVFWA